MGLLRGLTAYGANHVALHAVAPVQPTGVPWQPPGGLFGRSPDAIADDSRASVPDVSYPLRLDGAGWGEATETPPGPGVIQNGSAPARHLRSKVPLFGSESRFRKAPIHWESRRLSPTGDPTILVSVTRVGASLDKPSPFQAQEAVREYGLVT